MLSPGLPRYARNDTIRIALDDGNMCDNLLMHMISRML